jgi:hypothetical protein
MTMRLLPLIALCASCASTRQPPPAAACHVEPPRAGAGGVAYYAIGNSATALKPLNETFKIVRVMPVPDGFVGHIAYDRDSRRLWLVSYGPPANTRSQSTLYEVEPSSGKILAQKALPFLGEFGAPLHRDGYLYVGVYHERKIYRVVVGDRARLGHIDGAIDVASINELDLRAYKDKVFRYPFFTFSALADTPDGKLLTHSDDLSQFITLDAETGRVLKQVATQPSVAGLASVQGLEGQPLVLGNSNPREFAMTLQMRQWLFRGSATAAPMASDAPVEETGVNWMLLDPQSGEVLSSIWHAPSRAKASGIALIRHDRVEGSLYGRYVFFALGHEGILTIEWTPSNLAWSVIDRGNSPQ